MNWKLIFSLNLFAVVIGTVSLFGWTGHFEWLIWLVVFVIYAWLIARNAPGRFFLHGFMVSLINGVIIGVIHAVFLRFYLLHNLEIALNLRKLPPNLDLRWLTLFVGPIVGALLGIISGLFAWIASKIVRKSTPLPSES
jgi:hypothetical protein